MTTPSKNQKKVLENLTTPDNLIIEAVAGSGKTTTIRMCVDAHPSNKQLYLVYNKEMQLETKSKFSKSGISHKVDVLTTHSFGFNLLAESVKPFKLIPTNTKYREYFNDYASILKKFNGNNYADTRRTLKDIWAIIVNTGMIPNINIKNDKAEFSWKKILDAIEYYGFAIGKVKNINGKDVRIVNGYNQIMDAMGLIYSEGLQKTSKGIIDFDDMIYMPLQPYFRGCIKNYYDVIYVDESQDLNISQILLLQKVAEANPKTKFVFVGDSRQAIYGFRLSLPTSMQIIKKRFACKELPLSVCYRCPKQVVELAKKIVPQIEYTPNAIEGEINELEQDDIADYINAIPDNDYSAIIAGRFNKILIDIFYELIKNENIKVKFKDSDGVLKKQVKNHLDNISNHNEDYLLSDFRKDANEYFINARNLLLEKKPTEEQIKRFEDVFYCISTMLTHYERMVLGIKQSIEDKTINDFRLYITDRLDARKAKRKKGVKYIELNTIHSLKGSEADEVFILLYNQMPFKFKNAKDWQFEQEVNLLYVAITRAKKKLHLVNKKNEESKN